MTHAYTKIALSGLVIAFSLWTFIDYDETISEEAPLCKSEIPVEESPQKETMPVLDAEEYYYNYGPRFSPIKHSQVKSAVNFYELVQWEDAPDLNHLTSMKLMLIVDEKWDVYQVEGASVGFSEEQLSFLQNLDYSDNFVVRVDYEEYNSLGQAVPDFFTPHLTVVPEQQARYSLGKDALLDYIREKNEPYTAGLSLDQIGSGKLYFTVTKEGKIENININGYKSIPAIDLNLTNLMQNLPGDWEPARNAAGENVDQELVLSFGNMGC